MHSGVSQKYLLMGIYITVSIYKLFLLAGNYSVMNLEYVSFVKAENKLCKRYLSMRDISCSVLVWNPVLNIVVYCIDSVLILCSIISEGNSFMYL
jgi:hypothetical protein